MVDVLTKMGFTKLNDELIITKEQIQDALLKTDFGCDKLIISSTDERRIEKLEMMAKEGHKQLFSNGLRFFISMVSVEFGISVFATNNHRTHYRLYNGPLETKLFTLTKQQENNIPVLADHDEPETEGGESIELSREDKLRAITKTK